MKRFPENRLFGSFASPDGVSIYGSAKSYKSLAQLVMSAEEDFELPPPPPELIEDGPVRGLHLRPRREGLLVLKKVGDYLEVTAGESARSVLADSLVNLAESGLTNVPGVPRHIDFEYFPENELMTEESLWASVYLLDD